MQQIFPFGGSGEPPSECRFDNRQGQVPMLPRFSEGASPDAPNFCTNFFQHLLRGRFSKAPIGGSGESPSKFVNETKLASTIQEFVLASQQPGRLLFGTLQFCFGQSPYAP